jgi:hypothetical protein
VADAEAEINRLEETRQNLLMQMAEPEVATNPEALAERDAALKQTEAEIQDAITEWERLSMRLEAFLDAPSGSQPNA